MKKFKKRKFTLVELLVVIGIIALLVGLLMPAVNAIRKSANRTKARALANALVVAIKQYEVTYGLFPAQKSDFESSDGSNETLKDDKYDDLIAILTLVDGPNGGDATKGNIKRTAFLDVDESYNKNGYVDPWKKNFKIGIDSNYDNKVKGLVSSDLNGKVFVYSLGADKTDSTSDDVFSWK